MADLNNHRIYYLHRKVFVQWGSLGTKGAN
jgi:hypothetical protein